MKDIKLHTWYYKEEYYSDVSNRKSLYYFTEDKPEDYILSCYYISKIVYSDGTSSMLINDDHNAYGVDLEDLTLCDNPEELYNKFVNDYQKLFKK
jgi:hypothetical protein